MPEETVIKLMDLMEKYLMTRLYRAVFCPVTTDDEEKDLEIQAKIRSLHWINTHILDAEINESREEVRNLVDQAITGERLTGCPENWSVDPVQKSPSNKDTPSAK